jgi:hypothetical protein
MARRRTQRGEGGLVGWDEAGRFSRGESESQPPKNSSSSPQSGSIEDYLNHTMRVWYGVHV